MGIEGLLKFLEPIVIKEHISSFQFQTAAIDIMSWLYKGCYRCAYQLNQNIESNNFLYYIFEMIDLLSYYKIKPICVFDGRSIMKKQDTIQKRKKSKEENKQRGLDYLKIGNEEEARKYLSRSITIDQRIITTTMRAFHTKGIDFMVAPYESDSQIAKLIKLGLADFAITEDSDLVIYGVKVALKLNQDGQCDYIDLAKCGPNDVDSVFLKHFLQMNHISRVESAVLTGTDYNSSIYGIGIKRAVKQIYTKKDMNKVVQYLRGVKPYSDRVPQNYQKTIFQSKLIFLFATTYNPFTKVLQCLNPQYLDEYLKLMPLEEIQKIVGKIYEYDQQVRTGRTSSRNFEKREIIPIDIKTIFTLNINNLQSRQMQNRQRRIEDAQAKARKEQERRVMAENGNLDNITTQSQKKKKKQTIPKIVLTQQEKKQQAENRRIQRLKRFNDFKQLLNNFIPDSSNQSESSQLSEDIIAEQCEDQKKQKEEIKPNSRTKKQTSEQDEKECEQSESEDQCLQYLNPWLRR